MAEPSKDTILAALARAKDLLKRNRNWDVLHALAEATTTIQCGMPGYLVFRDVRTQLGRNITQPLPDFAQTATRTVAIDAIDRTIQTLRENT